MTCASWAARGSTTEQAPALHPVAHVLAGPAGLVVATVLRVDGPF